MEQMISTARRVPAMLILALFMLGNPAARAESGSASDTAQRFQAELLDVMKIADTLDVGQRFKRLAPTVDRSFHLPLMTQIATGQSWSRATMDEREKLVQAFRRMSIATLATLFSGYSGETFHVTDEKPGPSQTKLVLTHLLKTDGEKVQIAYIVRQFKVGWRMIDVIVDNGISELKVRRSEYNLVLKKGGVPALIALLNGKADELMSQ
jgi:phospholipid transport system substrate-binding protein